MADEMGKCPGCDEEGPVGDPCDEKACQKHDYRYIPEQHWAAAHDSEGRLRDPVIGRRIGDFLVVGLIGSGGFGTVYLALQHPLYKLRGALKLLEPPTDNEEFAEAMLEKFQNEAEVLADLNHPNVVKLLKYGIHQRHPYLVMEYVDDAVTLREEIARRAARSETFQRDELEHIFNQILDGLSAAHERGVIHRDLKPENIMLQEIAGDPTHVRLVDFGLAKAVEERTDTDWMIGSTSYMAPEQISQSNLGIWTDLYSLGVIFFELVTGRKPYRGDTDAQVVERKLDENYDPFNQLDHNDYDTPLESFIRKALARLPDNRFQEVSEFRSGMQTAFGYMQDEAETLGPETANLTMLVDSSDVLEVYESSDSAQPPALPETPDGEPAAAASASSEDATSTSGSLLFVLGGGLVAVLAAGFYFVQDGGMPNWWLSATQTVSETERTDIAEVDVRADVASDATTVGAPDVAPDTTDVSDTEDLMEAGPTLSSDAFTQLSLGKFHTCGLRVDGDVRCWGGNYEGELGLGHTRPIGDNEPAREAGLVGFGTPAVQLEAAGDRLASHTCVRLQSGDVRCWGANSHGQLGLGHTDRIGDDEAPGDAPAISIGGKAVDIASGASRFGSHVCALLASGVLRCWGSGKFGKLGYGHTNDIGDDEKPVTAGYVPVGGKVSEVAAGKYNTCVVLENGDLRCWGWNRHGQLGLGHTDAIGDDELPTSAEPIEVGGTVESVSVGRRHICALLEGGEVRCWGWNKFGQLGLGHTEDIGDDEKPASVKPVPLRGEAVQVLAGGIHSCALLDSGDVQCWGDNRFGQLGYGHENKIGVDRVPERAGTVATGGEVRSLAIGKFHTCALYIDGDVHCWGLNKHGQLGYGHTNEIGDDEPVRSVSPVPAR